MANTTSLVKVGSYRSALEFYRGRRKSNSYRNVRYSLDVHVSRQSLSNELGTINTDEARPAAVWVRMHRTNIAEFIDNNYHPHYEFAILRTGGWLSSPTTRAKISELYGIRVKSRAFGPTLKARAVHGVAWRVCRSTSSAAMASLARRCSICPITTWCWCAIV